MNSDYILQIKNVTKRFPGVVALREMCIRDRNNTVFHKRLYQQLGNLHIQYARFEVQGIRQVALKALLLQTQVVFQ